MVEIYKEIQKNNFMMSNISPLLVSKESSANSDQIYEEIPKSQMKMSLPNIKHNQSNSTF